jgi:hypothetical protein
LVSRSNRFVTMELDLKPFSYRSVDRRYGCGCRETATLSIQKKDFAFRRSWTKKKTWADAAFSNSRKDSV